MMYPLIETKCKNENNSNYSCRVVCTMIPCLIDREMMKEIREREKDE